MPTWAVILSSAKDLITPSLIDCYVVGAFALLRMTDGIAHHKASWPPGQGAATKTFTAANIVVATSIHLAIPV